MGLVGSVRATSAPGDLFPLEVRLQSNPKGQSGVRMGLSAHSAPWGDLLIRTLLAEGPGRLVLSFLHSE